MAEIISTIVALVATFALGYGVRGEREAAHRRANAVRITELEAANARLRDHLRVSLAISEHYLKQQFADDLAKRVAEGPTDNFQQQMRSLHVYGSSIRTPYTPGSLGGSGV